MLDEDSRERRMVIADIPGLIEGASAGAGLGHRFLRHVERTRFLVHILSIEDMAIADPWAGFELINEELAAYDADLALRRQIEVVNKTDAVSPETVAAFREAAAASGRRVFFMSALTGEGVREVVAAMWRLFDSLDLNDPLVIFREAVMGEDEREDGPEVVWTRE